MGHLLLKCMTNGCRMCVVCVSRFAKLYFKHIELKLNVNDTILRKNSSARYMNVNVFSHKSKSIMKSFRLTVEKIAVSQVFVAHHFFPECVVCHSSRKYDSNSTTCTFSECVHLYLQLPPISQ